MNFSKIFESEIARNVKPLISLIPIRTSLFTNTSTCNYACKEVELGTHVDFPNHGETFRTWASWSETCKKRTYNEWIPLDRFRYSLHNQQCPLLPRSQVTGAESEGEWRRFICLSSSSNHIAGNKQTRDPEVIGLFHWRMISSHTEIRYLPDSSRSSRHSLFDQVAMAYREEMQPQILFLRKGQWK